MDPGVGGSSPLFHPFGEHMGNLLRQETADLRHFYLLLTIEKEIGFEFNNCKFVGVGCLN